jgi:tRNA-splicing ligase RtcB
MMHKRDEASLGLDGIDCVAFRPERRIEEAPAAYKPIDPVIAIQNELQMMHSVARLRPVLTFKA